MLVLRHGRFEHPCLIYFQVYLAARDEGKVNAAIDQLRKDNAGITDGSLHSLKLELSDPRAVKRAAEEFLQKETRLDILGESYRFFINPCAFKARRLFLLVNNAAMCVVDFSFLSSSEPTLLC